MFLYNHIFAYIYFQKMAEHPIFAPYTGKTEEGVVEAPENPLTEGLAQLKFSPDHNTPEGMFHFRLSCPFDLPGARQFLVVLRL